ncbi:ABC transporter permease/substrate-binding protein [Dellaglioa sp. BT-FLS60]
MRSVWHVLTTQHAEIVKALLQHIEISIIALVIAVIIAVPLGILLMNRPKIAEIILQVTSVLQTIPSLALLGILIPLVGIGMVPTIIALVAYAVMPIFQNTYSGLTSIDPQLEEVATALGLTRWMKLRKFELPIALPMIVSGVRIAVVMIIGTATLAALIGAGGLGTYIILGIETNDNSLLIIGAGLSALLAILFSLIIKKMISFSGKKIGITLLIMALLGGGVAGYRYLAQPKSTITIAGKMGSEPEILINMYKDLIESNDSQVNVQVKPNFGGTSFLFKALRSGSVDIYPEFTGTVLESLVKTNQKVTHNPNKTYQVAANLLKNQYQMTYLSPMKYQNGYTLAVTQSLAKKYHLKTISDLKSVSAQIHAGFDPDFYQLSDGYPGLKKAYDLNFTSVKTMEPTIRYTAIANGKVNLVDGYTTDSQIKQYHLVMLKDDKSFFPPYQGAPLLSDKTIREHPEIKGILSKLSGKITVSDMQTMNYAVTVKHEKAATVARNYLLTHHLLKE